MWKRTSSSQVTAPPDIGRAKSDNSCHFACQNLMRCSIQTIFQSKNKTLRDVELFGSDVFTRHFINPKHPQTRRVFQFENIELDFETKMLVQSLL
jgi:hypothetical protein